jgi:hypothetical protein
MGNPDKTEQNASHRKALLKRNVLLAKYPAEKINLDL